MRETVEVKNTRQIWAKSIFKVIDKLVEHNNRNDSVFAIGFGSECGTGLFDIIKTVESKSPEKRSYGEILEDILILLESNGAKYVRVWAQQDTIEKVVTYDNLSLLSWQLSESYIFLKHFMDLLPKSCRDDSYTLQYPLIGRLKDFGEKMKSYVHKITENQVQNMMRIVLSKYQHTELFMPVENEQYNEILEYILNTLEQNGAKRMGLGHKAEN